MLVSTTPTIGNAELVRLQHGDLLVPHIGHVQDVGEGLGVLDAAEAALEPGEVPAEAERLLLAHPLHPAVLLHRLHLPEAAMDARTVLKFVSIPPSQRWST